MRSRRRYKHADQSRVTADLTSALRRETAARRKAEAALATLMHSDHQERSDLEQKLRLLSTTDTLTGLTNRQGLLDALGEARQRLGPSSRSVTLVLLDLDRFKLVNDTLGHATGDHLLEEAALRLRSCLGADDMAARLGSDEFATICHDLADNERALVATRIIDALSAPYEIFGTRVSVGVSVGLAISSDPDLSPAHLLQQADIALYRAKADGSRSYHVFDAALAEIMREQADLERDLRQAVARCEFFLTFQPRVNATTGEPVAAEALLRWQHPKHGVILPGEFIPMAEEVGLINEIGEWVLREACAQIANWWDHGIQVPVSVNMSAAQLNSSDIVELVSSVLRDACIPAQSLQIEITESMLMGSYAENARTLSRLREMGVKILLDDFGTGYSSLSYLLQLPIDKLKIDRSFVEKLSDPTHAALTQSIVGIGHNLSLHVVAEGVERSSQADFLKAIGCDELQGYLFAHPMRARDFEIWISGSEYRSRLEA
jgi:diguanylate cyclase (GGDEF)-like protein